MRRSIDAPNRSLRSIHRSRIRSGQRLRWGLWTATAVALTALSCGDVDPTGQDLEASASLASPPGQVDDLRVLDVSDTSVTLVWTEVDDGFGSAPDYQVRYAASPIGYGWGSATVVSSGTCASPIDGVAVDSILECTVEGLEAEAQYDFQLVAFRGTLGEDAVFGDLSNVATGTTEAPPGPPAQVTDLAVSDVSDTGATLRFTEVDDGAGEPASYQVRYAESPIGYGWGSATIVTEGSCASPVAGSAIDSTFTCSVAGLGASTAYDFQLVAFRDELGVDAEFGELSNVASGTTEASAPSGTAAPPEQVTDLAVAAVSDSSATLRFTEVDNGTGGPADYQVRYAESPIGYGWGSATVVTEGSCASPVAGTAVDSTLTCTVAGLAASTAYDFQLVAFRGELGVDAEFGELSNVASGSTAPPPPSSAPPSTGTGGDCANPAPEWIWCDDFEKDRLASYFEYDDAGGSFTRAAAVGLDGSYGMRAHWATGQVSAGALHLAFGRTPQAHFRPVDAGTADYREVYWRMYVRNEAGWTGGGGDKLSRAMIFASSTSWAQAMIAHVWSGSSSDRDYLKLDPASGTDEAGNLQTTTYNDFGNLRWLGAVLGATPLFDAAHVGTWHCVEARVRLNDAGLENGVFELWVNGELDARRTGLNWVGSFDDYGINAVFFENYWNAGSPADQERYFDDIVVSTAPIGCDGATSTEVESAAATLSVTPAVDTLNAIGYSLWLDVAAFDSAGEPTTADVVWSSLDADVATVDKMGKVTSQAVGTALITATAACCADASDTARIDVRQVPASVAVSPSSKTLAVGDTVRLSATVLDSAGVPMRGGPFTWSSSDILAASVDADGLVTALAPDTTSVMAATDDMVGSAAIRVDDGLVTDAHPNEPTGFGRIAEHSFEAALPLGPPGGCETLGILDGCWFVYDPGSNYAVLSLASSPTSPPGVMRVRFRNGLSGGASPGLFQGWNTGSESSSTDYQAVYESGWIRVPTPDFEMQRVGVKFLGYLGVGQAGSHVPNQIYFFSYNPQGEQSVQTSARVSVVQQGIGDRAMHQNVVNDPVLTFGAWHHYEYVMVLNDIGVANGVLKVWWNGELITHYTDVVWRTSSAPSGFYGRRWDPVWGGSGGGKTRDDYLEIDHLYISTQPF